MLHYMRMKIRTMTKSERGASAVEYGVLVALIAIIIIGGVTILGKNLNQLFNETSGHLPAVPGDDPGH